MIVKREARSASTTLSCKMKALHSKPECGESHSSEACGQTKKVQAEQRSDMNTTNICNTILFFQQVDAVLQIRA